MKISYNKGTLGSSLLGSVDDTVIKTANNMEEYKKESSTMYRIKAKLSSDVLVGRQTHIKGESYLSGIAFYGWTNEERWKDYYCTGTVDILDKDSTAYRPGANIYITGDTEVYPVLIGAKADSKTPYNLENVISVTCNQNDYLHAFTGEATWVDANEYIYTFIKGEPFTLPHHEVTNYKTSYKFVGWTDKDVSGPKLAGSYTVADADYEDEHHFNASDTDIYLYALWQK